MTAEPSATPQPAFEVMLIEDNPGDAALTAEALAAANRHSTLHVARSGELALEFLRSGDVRPDLILLDLNLPGIDGRLVLRALKADTRLRNIPVLVLSASASPQDIAAAYDLGATSYIVKPPSYAEYEQMMKVVDLYWFSVVARPAKR